MKRKLYLILSLILLSLYATAQNTEISGIVVDNATKEPIPYASIGLKNTTIGTITDEEGEFHLTFKNQTSDTVIVQNLGYLNDTIKITLNRFNNLKTIYLKEKSYDIEAVVVTPGENPAHILLRKVIKAKKQNNPYKLDGFSYEAYTKMQLDINNFDPKIADTKYMKKFAIVYEGMDTAQNGKVYMPLLLSENISDFYFQRRPRKQKEVIKAVNISGVENESVTKYTGNMYAKINFYENYMSLFQKQFVSPIAFNGLMVYKYYLTDSAYIDDAWCREITFRPRRKHEYTFEGNMWIEDKTNALKKIYARVSKTANVDFVSEMIIKQSFEKVDDIYFLQYEDFFTDINLGKKTTGFFARKITSRKNIKINPEFPDKLFAPGTTNKITPDEEASLKNQAYWDSARHMKLEKKEAQIYVMTDSIKNLKAYKNIERFTSALFTGYYPLTKIEIGPIYETYSYNSTEGNRIQASFRTLNKFSKKFEINAHTAFGFRDQRLKYGSLIKYKINKSPWTIAQVSYNHDMNPLGIAFANYSDNVFSSLLSRQPNDNLLLQNDFAMDIQRDLRQGIFLKTFVNHKEIFPSETMPFATLDNKNLNILRTFEAGVTLHLGFNEEYVEANFSRLSLGSLYPITEISYTAGIPIFGNEYKYHKVNLVLSQRLLLGPFGKFKYTLEAGQVFGKVPFPLLKLFAGNESYMLRRHSFNLMNIYEFAADRYVSLFAIHHFQGLFLNKIPFMRKLKWREVAFLRGAIGSLKDANRKEFQFPGYLNDVSKPYFEGGVGIENIFNFFRVDAIWRLSHLSNPDAPNFGVRLAFYVAF